jgi:hypothetical protein
MCEYNSRRLHTTLGDLTPMEFEQCAELGARLDLNTTLRALDYGSYHSMPCISMHQKISTNSSERRRKHIAG